MNLFELFAKIGVDDQASGKIGAITEKLGKGLQTAAKIGTAAVATAMTAIGALTAQAVKNFAEYEQLVGGVDTLFKESSAKVQQYAAEAFSTAGVSANEYMSIVTSFSASLLQSLAGDTEKAAEYANQALTDMSDNVNKMGTDMLLIKNAYQGFAKANYTMLDNLKLGYGGTKTEMERLIQDAAKLDKTIKANDLSFANIVKAIHAVQVELEISGISYEEYTQLVESGAMTQEEAFALLGTTAKEARYTISGSLNSMKAAWSNLITGLADENANFDSLIDNMIDTASAFADNVLPRIETAIGGISKVLHEYVPQVLPNLVNALTQALTGEEELPIITLAKDVVKTFAKAITDNKEGLAQGGLSLVTQLASGVVSATGDLTRAAGELIGAFVEEIFKTENIEKVFQAASNLVTPIIDVLGSPEKREEIATEAGAMAANIGVGITRAGADIITGAITLTGDIIAAIQDGDWDGTGWQTANAFWNSFMSVIESSIDDLWENHIQPMFDALWEIERRIMGYKEEMASLESPMSPKEEQPQLPNPPIPESDAPETSVEPTATAAGVTVIQNIYSQKQTAADILDEAVIAQRRNQIMMLN